MAHKKEWKKKGKWYAVGAGVLLLAGVLLCLFAAPSAGELLSRGEELRSWTRQHPWAARLAYAGAVMFQVLLAVIPGEPLEIAGGYLFGAVEGTLLCLGAAAAGSVMVFCLVRRLGVRLVELMFTVERLRPLHFLQSSPKRIFLFWLVFMLPGTPKDLLCYYAGLTDMKLSTFLLICSFGRIPSLVTSTVGGDALGMESYLAAGIVFGATLLISGMGFLCYGRICRRHAADPGEEQKESVFQGNGAGTEKGLRDGGGEARM